MGATYTVTIRERDGYIYVIGTMPQGTGFVHAMRHYCPAIAEHYRSGQSFLPRLVMEIGRDFAEMVGAAPTLVGVTVRGTQDWIDSTDRDALDVICRSLVKSQ